VRAIRAIKEEVKCNLSPILFFSQGEGVKPSWFVGRRMCVTLARKSASILFSRQNKLAGCIFAACLSMYCISCRGRPTTTDRLMCIATLPWRGWSVSVSVLACHCRCMAGCACVCATRLVRK